MKKLTSDLRTALLNDVDAVYLDAMKQHVKIFINIRTTHPTESNEGFVKGLDAITDAYLNAKKDMEEFLG